MNPLTIDLCALNEFRSQYIGQKQVKLGRVDGIDELIRILHISQEDSSETLTAYYEPVIYNPNKEEFYAIERNSGNVTKNVRITEPVETNLQFPTRFISSKGTVPVIYRHVDQI